MTALSLKRHSRGLGLSPRRHRGASGAAPAYAATPVSFDGATHLTRGDALTGVSDSKTWSGSIWLRLAATDGFFRSLNAASDRFSLLYFGGGPSDYALFGFNPGGSEILRLLIDFPGANDTNWHHLLWSFDLANASARHFYLDDVSTGTWATYNNDTIDFTVPDVGVGADAAGNNKWNGDMADVWMRFGGAVIDFSVEANRRQFISAEGKPANPAGWPAGGQVQLHGALDDWHVNKGSGGGFTENGALLAGTGPVQLP
jgi:hypothetical protein